MRSGHGSFQRGGCRRTTLTTAPPTTLYRRFLSAVTVCPRRSFRGRGGAATQRASETERKRTRRQMRVLDGGSVRCLQTRTCRRTGSEQTRSSGKGYTRHYPLSTSQQVSSADASPRQHADVKSAEAVATRWPSGMNDAWWCNRVARRASPRRRRRSCARSSRWLGMSDAEIALRDEVRAGHRRCGLSRRSPRGTVAVEPGAEPVHPRRRTGRSSRQSGTQARPGSEHAEHRCRHSDGNPAPHGHAAPPRLRLEGGEHGREPACGSRPGARSTARR